MDYILIVLLVVVIIAFFVKWMKKANENNKENKENEGKEVEEGNMTWEQLKKDMQFGKHYAQYYNLLSLSELDKIYDNGWELVEYDNEFEYIFKRRTDTILPINN